MMKVFLILSALGLVAAWRLGRAWPGQRILLAGLALLLLSLSVSSLYRSRHPSEYTPTTDLAIGQTFGAVLANAVAPGPVLVIQPRSKIRHLEEVARAQRKGLLRGLGGRRWTLVEVGPAFVFEPGQGFMEPGYRASDLDAWVQEHPEVVAVASFIGLPAGGPGTAALPPMVVLESGAAADAYPDEALHLLAVAGYHPGLDPRRPPAPDESVQDVFRQRFTWHLPPPPEGVQHP